MDGRTDVRTGGWTDDRQIDRYRLVGRCFLIDCVGV